MGKILIVTHHFPPDAAIGAVRPAELAKHLPAHGWEPVVLTVRDKYCQYVDAGRYTVCSVKTHRTRKLGTVNDAYLFFKKLREKVRPSQHKLPAGKEWFTAEANQPERWRSRLVRYYNSLLVYLPDKESGWILPAITRGLRIVYSERIDAVLTTSPPHSVHLIGLGLKILTGRKWIADFRDPWEVELKPRRSRSRLSEYLDSRMERAVVRRCDQAVSVTARMTKRLEAKFPAHRLKFTTIPNGFDAEALEPYRNEKKHDVFTISYVGSLYFGRDPRAFFQSLAGLISQGRMDAGEVRIRLVGDCKASDGKSVTAMVEELNLQDVVQLVDRVPQAEALREIARAHAVLLLAPAQPLQIPGKVYEYIGLGARIIAVCGEGATRDLLSSYPLAHIVEPGDARGMGNAILMAREAGSAVAGDGQPFCTRAYERNEIARQFTCLLADEPSRHLSGGTGLNAGRDT